MRALPVIWALVCCIPFALIATAPLFPSGIDPRGFGPRFALSVYACIGSFIIALFGLALIMLATRLKLKRGFILATTLVGAGPFFYLLALIILRKV